MYHADNDFGYEPTSEDLQDWYEQGELAYGLHQVASTQDSGSDSDPFVSLSKEGPFWSPVYVFTRKSGQRLEFNSKEYAELVNSQR